jgi:hypothetical protein
MQKKSTGYLASAVLGLGALAAVITGHVRDTQADDAFAQQHTVAIAGWVCDSVSGHHSVTKELPPGGNFVPWGPTDSGLSDPDEPLCGPIDAQGNGIQWYCAPHHIAHYLGIAGDQLIGGYGPDAGRCKSEVR